MPWCHPLLLAIRDQTCLTLSLDCQHSCDSSGISGSGRISKKHVQNLSKHCTEATKKYQVALECLAKSRDEYASPTPILNGDLAPLNRKSKLHPKCDG